LYVEDVTDQFLVGDDWNDFTFSEAVMIDHTQPLWICMYYTGPAAAFGPGITEDMGTYDPNGDLYWEDGAWTTLAVGSGIDNRAWLMRGYVTTDYGTKVAIGGGNVDPLPVTPGLTTATTLSETDATLTQGSMRSERALTHFNVYRSTDGAMGTYELLGTVDAEEGVGEYCYFDAAEIGEYCYKVTAVYMSDTDECESDYAMDVEEMYDYVCVLITDVENPNALTTNLYPNPTRDQVTITASAEMTRITVINYVGQVVMDSEMNQSKYVLNTSNFESGVYVVRIETESEVITKRFAVAR
jgi:hypothetical protein